MARKLTKKPSKPTQKKEVKVNEEASQEKVLDPNQPQLMQFWHKYWQHIVLVAILVGTFLLHSPALKNGFIYFDDPELVIDNYSIREITWENILYYFQQPYQMMYLPPVLLSYAIDYQFGGLDPYVYHLTNVIIHVLNVLLVYWIFQLMTKKFHIALFVTVIFAVHPVNVDTIAWVGTRNNLLTALFYLAALLLYTLYLERNYKLRYLIFSAVAFLLSVLAKSSSVVFPIIMLLWDYYYGRVLLQKGKPNWRLVLEKVPFLLIALAFGLITLHFRTDIVPPVQYSLFDRFIMFWYSLVDYIARLFAPLQLSMAYQYPEKNGDFLPIFMYLCPFILAFMIWVLYKLRVPVKVIVVGMVFFMLNIALSQAVVLIDNFKANRYSYIAYFGLFFILAVFSDQILSSTTGWRARLKPRWVDGLIVVAAIFSFLTFTRYAVWRDTITLFDDVSAKQPNMPWVYNNRGIAKYKNNDYDAALADFNKALELDPNFPLSLYYRGVISYLRSDYQSALTDLNTAVSLVPDFSSAYNDRGKTRYALLDNQGAMEDFTKALELDERFVDAYHNRGKVRYDTQDYHGAISDYSNAIYYYPEYSEAYYNRGLARMALGDHQGALGDFSEAINLFPSYAEAFFRRSVVKLNLNDMTGSCADLNTAKSLGYQPGAQETVPNCPA